MSDDLIDFDQPVPESHTYLEQKLITEYLSDKGFTRADLEQLPSEQAKQLMSEACSYANLKLAEIESRSKFRKKIQGPS
jgi:hypothetical protein